MAGVNDLLWRNTLRSSVRPQTLALAALAALVAVQPGQAAEAWPATVEARYKLKFNGIDVGHIAFSSKTTAKTYALNSNGQVSVLFGAVKWIGTSNVSGAIEAAAPAPKAYAFDWKKNSKGGAIKIGYAGGKAASVSVDPPPSDSPEVIPVTDQHRTGALDPLSAIMALSRSDQGDPCNRRVAVFDGKQRFNIVLSAKRRTLIPAPKSGGASTIGFVCRAMYEPIAGHKANGASKSYAANPDAEVVFRQLPGSGLLIPQSVTIPTPWGTGSMVMETMTVTSASAGQVALSE
jgi:Protein of unknown function (DUF3108)